MIYLCTIMTSTAHSGSNFLFSQSQEFSSPYVSVSGNGSKLPVMESNASKYRYRVQSSHFRKDNDHYDKKEINALVLRNLDGRVTQVNEILATTLFLDTAFGFQINNQFLSNFFQSFLSSTGLLDPADFASKVSTCTFLNQMISTINVFLQATKEPDLENFQPQHYFTSLHSTRPIMGSKVKQKPDLVLVHLIDGCLRQGTLHWHDIQTLIEHTCEPKPPIPRNSSKQKLPNILLPAQMRFHYHPLHHSQRFPYCCGRP